MKAKLVGGPIVEILGVLWSLLGIVGLALVGLDAVKGLRLDGNTASLAIGAIYFGLCLVGGVQLFRESPRARVVLLTCAAILIIYAATLLALVGLEFGAIWTYLALVGLLFGALSVTYLRRTRGVHLPPA